MTAATFPSAQPQDPHQLLPGAEGLMMTMMAMRHLRSLRSRNHLSL
jgi:hypothetical protein